MSEWVKAPAKCSPLFLIISVELIKLSLRSTTVNVGALPKWGNISSSRPPTNPVGIATFVISPPSNYLIFIFS